MDCTAFLQWALPQLEFRWPGFRKVRRQVCKRLNQRMRGLGLEDFAAYRARLEADPSEWHVLDECCHITISRFFRDRGVFEALRRRVLPDIAARAKSEGRGVLAWSAGCASGEEPYTLSILWDFEIAETYPGIPLSIIATDVDKPSLARAHRGCFEPTSLHELPPQFIEQAFDRVGAEHCVKQRHRDRIEFLDQDLRQEVPPRLFDLVLCRYLAFTYFALPLQRQVLLRMLGQLRPGGYFVIGSHEELPGGVPGLVPLAGAPKIFRKEATGQE